MASMNLSTEEMLGPHLRKWLGIVTEDLKILPGPRNVGVVLLSGNISNVYLGTTMSDIQLQSAQTVRQIIFPGVDGQPCVASYGIAFRRELIAQAEIVVVQNHEMSGTSLWNTDAGRNNVLNRILANDLAGVRIEFVRFTAIFDAETGLHAMRFPIHLDDADFVAKGNPAHRVRIAPRNVKEHLLKVIGLGPTGISWWSGHVTAGCARTYVEFSEGEHLPRSESAMLLKAIGYERVSSSLKAA